MPRTKSIYSARLAALAIALIVLLSYPLGAIALAEGSAPGPSAPTGASASSYTYNPATGLWENDYYTWDPATNLAAPKTPQTYSYNPSTGMWDTTEWIWDAPSGKYIPNVITLANDPSITYAGPDSTNTIDQT